MSGVVVPTMMTPMSSGVDAGLRDRLDRRLLREVGRRHARIDDVALADAGALQDPLVVGVDHPLEIVVGQQPRRHVGGEPADADRPQPRTPEAPAFVGRRRRRRRALPCNHHSR